MSSGFSKDSIDIFNNTVFSGNPTITDSISTSDNSTKIATTAFVKKQNYVSYNYTEFTPSSDFPNSQFLLNNSHNNAELANLFSITNNYYYEFIENSSNPLNDDININITSILDSRYPQSFTLANSTSKVIFLSSAFKFSNTGEYRISIIQTKKGSFEKGSGQWNVGTSPGIINISSSYNDKFIRVIGNNVNGVVGLFNAKELVDLTNNIRPKLTIWNTLTNNLTLKCSSSLFIGNKANFTGTFVLSSNDQITLLSDGTSWIANK